MTSHVSNRDRRSILRRSWASLENLNRFKGVTYKVVYIVGRNSNKSSLVELHREMKKFGDIIQGNIEETYFNLTLKVQMGVDWAVRFCTCFDYVLKTDDDMYINLDLVSGYVSKLHPSERNFGGKCMMYHTPNRNKKNKWYMSEENYRRKKYPPFCIGAMYIMSMSVAVDIRRWQQL